jgi:SAM-dependent methyltransferase
MAIPTAAERWRADLEAWALPQWLLDSADASPYDWPVELMRRVTAGNAAAEPTTTLHRVIELAGDGGSVLDVGAGTGRLAVPLARAGLRVTAVEPDAAMRDSLSRAAGDVLVAVVEGSWPEAAGRAGFHDVVLAANVVYDVADLGPFLAALGAAATKAVVIECGPRHPWSPLRPLFRELHGLELPAGPTVEDLVAVISEVVWSSPQAERWDAGDGFRFSDLDELLAFYRRRLVLPVGRTDELLALIGDRIREVDGRFTAGEDRRQKVTVWWGV